MVCREESELVSLVARRAEALFYGGKIGDCHRWFSQQVIYALADFYEAVSADAIKTALQWCILQGVVAVRQVAHSGGGIKGAAARWTTPGQRLVLVATRGPAPAASSRCSYTPASSARARGVYRRPPNSHTLAMNGHCMCACVLVWSLATHRSEAGPLEQLIDTIGRFRKNMLVRDPSSVSTPQFVAIHQPAQLSAH